MRKLEMLHNKMSGVKRKISLNELNTVLTCPLCKGYLVDATSLVDCSHVFCRGCIVKNFEYNKTGCPSCGTLYKKKTQPCFRPDPQVQAVVYKAVPGLYAKEMQRREDFYRSTGVRASSSCSDDSVLERERDMINDQEEMISSYVGDKTQFFCPEDQISLSLEFYQNHLDTTSNEKRRAKILVNNNNLSEKNYEASEHSRQNGKCDVVHKNNGSAKISDNSVNCDIKDDGGAEEGDKRFLQCPAAVSMKHLQKFVRMKFGLTEDHTVDVIYKGEVLPLDFSLMDVAYTFKWNRTKPMRFFYRILTPMKKIRPIKIINTTLSTGGKQLQIVPAKPIMSESTKLEKKPLIKEEDLQETEDQKNHKEKSFFAQLQLQSKSKVQTVDNKKVPEKTVEDCVFDYSEPDKEEIKRFAEKRDREWALQKKLDESRTDHHHSTKKRKKSKHSKNESVHKKCKLHAEITPNKEPQDLKLKVKLVNGHKHKHHKSLSHQTNGKTESTEGKIETKPLESKTDEARSKEKLLQMRQIRHKQVQSEDKNIQTVPALKLAKDIRQEKPPVPVQEKQLAVKPLARIETVRRPEQSTIKPEVVQRPLVTSKGSDASSSKIGQAAIAKQRQEMSLKCMQGKVPTVHLERNEQTEKQAQKTFLKVFQACSDSYQKKPEKIQQSQKDHNQKVAKVLPTTTTTTTGKVVATSSIAPAKVVPSSSVAPNNINTNNKTLDRKIANLQQHCTIETKTPSQQHKVEKVEKKVTFKADKPVVLNPTYPPGFTVSKIESGVKRKAEESEKIQDKRPSLEITLINPSPASSPAQNSNKPDVKPPAKRPPPGTIPLERIKKSIKLGVSIIPKLPSENVGPLDLSNKSPETSPKAEQVNGFNRPANNSVQRPGNTSDKMQLSNLQMLSKVAAEHHPNMNKTGQKPQAVNNKPRQQMPNLQTIKTASQAQNAGLKVAHQIPKLNEIKKYQSLNVQCMRNNIRANQNQSIRNIPNIPSLLMKQQQNRLNSINSTMQTPAMPNTSKDTSKAAVTKDTPVVASANSATVKTGVESKIVEKKEISV